jgi:hypothetical protein
VADGDRLRVEIGFEGGQVIGGFVDVAAADELQRALHEDGPRVIVLDTDDGPYHVVVPKVSYFKRFNRSSRVGFGTG